MKWSNYELKSEDGISLATVYMCAIPTLKQIPEYHWTYNHCKENMERFYLEFSRASFTSKELKEKIELLYRLHGHE